MTSVQELPGPLGNLLIEQCQAIWEAALKQPEIEQVALFWMDDQGAQIASPLLKVTGRWDRFVLIEPELPHSYDARAVTVALSLQIRSSLHEPFRAAFAGDTWPAQVVTMWTPSDGTAVFDVHRGPLRTEEQSGPSQFMEDWVAEQNECTSGVGANVTATDARLSPRHLHGRGS